MNLQIIHEPDNWGDCLKPIHVLACLNEQDRLEGLCKRLRLNDFGFYGVFNTSAIFSIVRLKMPRKKNVYGSANQQHNDKPISSGNGNGWRWINVELDDSDIELVEQSDSTLEYLAACVLSLADDGYGVSVKPVDGGKSICCTIYRPDFPDTGVTAGLSSFGGSVHDALLSALYKFDEKCGGEFTREHLGSSADKPKRRFR